MEEQRHKHTHRHKHRINVASVILAFILSILLAIEGYMIGALFGIFRSDLIMECATDNDYYNQVYNGIISNAINSGKPLMLPDETYNNVYDKAEVYNDIKQAFYANLDNRTYTADTSKIRENLKVSIYKYASDNKINLTPEQEKTIDSFITKLEGQYKEQLNIPFISYYFTFKNTYNKFFLYVVLGLLLLIAVDVFFLMRSQQYRHRAMRYVSYSTIAAAIMTGSIPLFLFIQGAYKNIAIKPDYIKDLLVSIINKSLFSFVYISLVFLLLSAILIYATTKIKKVVRKKN